MAGQSVLSRLQRPLSDVSALTTARLLLTTAGTLTAGLSLWLFSDYHAWLALGTGGSPPNLQGYWRMTRIRLVRLFSRDSLRDASPLSPAGTVYLRGVPLPDRTARRRPRTVSRPMPQRQHPVPIEPEAKARLLALPHTYCAAHPDVLDFALSKTEGGSADAIYAKPGLEGRDPAAVDAIAGHEIAHVHPSDRSLHVWLSEADARTVVERGWGERFPLGAMGRVHPGFTFVYAPETAGDLEVVERIVEAGIAFLTGKVL